jgi:hypothetical protein
MAEDATKKKSGFSPNRLHSSELIGFLGAIVLFGSLFLTWFSTDCSAPGTPAGCNGSGGAQFNGKLGDFTAFQSFKILDWLLIAACAAPFILAYIIVRDHELSWGRGELTAVVAIAAAGLIFYNGIIDRPGEPSGAISVAIGWFGMMLGAIVMMVGAVQRSSETDRARKPPGVL